PHWPVTRARGHGGPSTGTVALGRWARPRPGAGAPWQTCARTRIFTDRPGCILLSVRLWDASPWRFASAWSHAAPRADGAPAPPRRALDGHAPSRGAKSDASPDVR